VLNTVGKKTEMLARLSTVAGEKGSADTARDPRGFALKFYYYWVINNRSQALSILKRWGHRVAPFSQRKTSIG
jgi:hypothetical protein